jgi:hypothetical protein
MDVDARAMRLGERVGGGTDPARAQLGHAVGCSPDATLAVVPASPLVGAGAGGSVLAFPVSPFAPHPDHFDTPYRYRNEPEPVLIRLLEQTGVGCTRCESGSNVGTYRSMASNHDYNTPEEGSQDWHLPLNDNFEELDTDVEVRDIEANLDQYRPKRGAKFFATDSGRIYLGDSERWIEVSTTGASPSFDALTSSKINGTVYVSSESELRSALGEETRIRLTGDITGSEFLCSYSSRDVVLDLNGYTIRRTDVTPEHLLVIRNPGGNVWVRNGRFDGNRRGQDFPERKGYKELKLSDAAGAYVSGISVVDNQGFSISTVDCDDVLVSDCTVNTRPAGLGSDGGGLDGVHVYDPRSVSVSGCSITSGDDSIAITAKDRRVNRVSVEGGTLSAPEHAGGVKLHIHGSAAPDAGFETVTIDSTIHDVAGNGIIFLNDSTNGGGVTNGRIAGTVTNAGVDGIHLNVPVRNMDISATVKDTSSHGINLRAGGRDVTVDGTVQNVTNYGIRLSDVAGVSIDAVVDGQHNMARGIRLANCSDVSISGIVKRTTRNSNANGIEGQNCRDIQISGASISEVDTPIESYDSSDYWTVTGNHGHSNNQPDVSLSGGNNVVASNRFSR